MAAAAAGNEKEAAASESTAKESKFTTVDGVSYHNGQAVMARKRKNKKKGNFRQH